MLTPYELTGTSSLMLMLLLWLLHDIRVGWGPWWILLGWFVEYC